MFDENVGREEQYDLETDRGERVQKNAARMGGHDSERVFHGEEEVNRRPAGPAR